LEADLDRLAAALDTALRSVLDTDEFDITRNDAGELDLSTDEWTLHLEGWPNGAGWLAVDDEPDEPAQYAAARRAVMSEAVERALAEVDRSVGGMLSRVLTAGGDPFTLDFADALRTSRHNADGTI
jgi:hypothetical protein